MHYFFVYQLLHVPLETHVHYWSAVAIELCIYFYFIVQSLAAAYRLCADYALMSYVFAVTLLLQVQL